MTPTTARAETAPEARSPLPGPATHCRAERPLTGATAPQTGVPILGPLGVKPADKSDIPGEGRPMVFGVHVSQEFGPADGRRIERELNDAAAAGKQLVEAEVRAAVAADTTVVAAKSREAKLREALGKYQQELKTAERDLQAAEGATADALRRGEDADPAGQREVALVEQVRQLKRRVAGTEAGLTETAAGIPRATAAIERSARARLRGQAEQELERLSSEIAGALFDRLHSLTRLRAAALAARD